MTQIEKLWHNAKRGWIDLKHNGAESDWHCLYLLLTREIDGHLLPGYQAYQNQYVRYIYRCDT